MHHSFILLHFTVFTLASADKYADYNKFPNRRQDIERNFEYAYDSTTDGYWDNGRGYCTNRTAQTDIEMDKIMGMWYGVEMIPHLAGSPGTFTDESCIVIHLAETAYEPSTEPTLYHHQTAFQPRWYRDYRHLKLLWDEGGNDLEYSLFFRNESVGFWNSHGEQTGTLPDYRSYQHFTGSVQVLKAVGDHLLLHFCQAPVTGNQAQLFSVLLSREPRKLQRWEIESAHALLRRKNLSVTTRRLVCGNGSNRLLVHFGTLVLVAIMSILKYA